jgi:hypothetical protein
MMTIRGSTSPKGEHLSGSFALKNDPEDGMVRIEIADRRVPPGEPIVDRVPAANVTEDTIRARIAKFVREWLAGP